ncbi:hypothetical protein [Brevibacterium litoralis]|uniref:hypothetical protein n=1 Tax=Brevibacterium litoralis TaxID=3138935 RepID=UPI0032ECD7FB
MAPVDPEPTESSEPVPEPEPTEDTDRTDTGDDTTTEPLPDPEPAPEPEPEPVDPPEQESPDTGEDVPEGDTEEGTSAEGDTEEGTSAEGPTDDDLDTGSGEDEPMDPFPSSDEVVPNQADGDPYPDNGLDRGGAPITEENYADPVPRAPNDPLGSSADQIVAEGGETEPAGEDEDGTENAIASDPSGTDVSTNATPLDGPGGSWALPTLVGLGVVALGAIAWVALRRS